MERPVFRPAGLMTLRRIHEAADAVETYSPAEEQFNRVRRTVGLVLGPALFIGLLLAPFNIPPAAQRLSAVLALMIVFWITEALPLAVTALLGPTLAVVLGITNARAAFAPFADPIIFLFIGSFILAEAMFVHRLDRRLAFTALASKWVGASGLRLVVVYAAVACFISMWMSNTATTAMLFPLGLAVLAELGRGRTGDRTFQEYAMAMMLVTSFAASIGGMGTPVGTPPNLIGRRFLGEANIDISFASWMLLCVPMVIVLMAVVVVWLLVPRARGIQLGDSARQAVVQERDKLGPISIGERNVLIAFGVTFALWVGPGVAQIFLDQNHPLVRQLNALIPEAVAAVIGALLLFLLPVNWAARKFTIDWDEASRIDWGIILLFGGGLSLGTLAESTGVAGFVGESLGAMGLARSEAGLLLCAIVLTIVVSEFASNTAAATLLVPMVVATAQAAGFDPVRPAIAVGLAATCGFVFPVSTPPNAIVFATGRLPLRFMIPAGVVLDLTAIVVIWLGLLWLGPLLPR
jgi:sodium-dependent dicarboxylate transporter 2/3/5